MKAVHSQNSLAIGALSLVLLLSLIIIFYFNGSGEEADSFHHYLIARFSFEHPYLFFNHWGKPLYTFLSSPFAQFGLIGSKVFNLICSLLASWFAYKVAKAVKLEQAALVIFFIFLIPLNFQVNFSAFTEPLFAMALVLGVWLMIQHHSRASLLLISFLPLIRSEGLIILAVFGLYLLLKKNYKKLPLLLFGQLFYGLLAWLFLGKSPLWPFNEIPYAALNSPYGSGDFFHFFDKLYYICGLPLLILFLIGFIFSLIRFRSRSAEWNILILGSFIAFFLFHSVAWSLGWFNSMGLKRVFGAITPLMGIIMLYGLNILTTYLKKPLIKKWVGAFWLVFASIFLFTNGPAAVNWEHEMNLSPSQELADQAGEYIQNEKINYERLIYADRYLQNSLQNDPYDSENFQLLAPEALENTKEGDLIIWDSWHAPTDFGVELKDLESRSVLKKLKEFERLEGDQRIQYVIFKKDS